ncbi:MAG: LacI family DNA-binding transcriptional regulator [Phyllobacterium sp.]|uniref:LacI family DNA-binding transcriptional regulator n=1 Tax=Phyllobacterium sp. TaxID=1871046 RepID=UPI0030F07FB9
MKLKELAEELRLSLTTVSRALNGYPEVKRQTRERVEEAAHRLGYIADTTARRLAVDKIETIGLVIPRETTSVFGPDIIEFINGLAEVFAFDDVDLLVSPARENVGVCRALVESRRADAIILCYPGPDDEAIRFLAAAKFPFVVFGQSRSIVPHLWVDVAHQKAAYQATAHMLDLGHKLVALIEAPKEFALAEQREAGYRQALEEYGISANRSLIVHDVLSEEAGYLHTRRLLKSGPLPTAFVISSVITAIGASRAIRERRLEDTISTITHDNVVPYLSPHTLFPSISTTSYPIHSVGKKVAEYALRLAHGEKNVGAGELLDTSLDVRTSSRGAPIKYAE